MAVARGLPRGVGRIAGAQGKGFGVAISSGGVRPSDVLTVGCRARGESTSIYFSADKIDLIPIRSRFQLSPLVRPRKEEAHSFAIPSDQALPRAETSAAAPASRRPQAFRRSPWRNCRTRRNHSPSRCERHRPAPAGVACATAGWLTPRCALRIPLGLFVEPEEKNSAAGSAGVDSVSPRLDLRLAGRRRRVRGSCPSFRSPRPARRCPPWPDDAGTGT